jgi:two-component system invasion response regulator UvrY
MIKIIIADDHALIRQGLKKTLEGEPDIRIVGEARNAAELLELSAKVPADILIVDINMPGRSGLDVLSELKRRNRKLRVVILSMYPEDSVAVRALKSGASGYVSKENAAEDLVKAIRKVAGGGTYVSTHLAEKLATDLQQKSDKKPHEELSEREYEVLCRIGAGRTVGEIAEELSLSVATISTYRSRILEKMKMKTSAELIHYAVKNKLVE